MSAKTNPKLIGAFVVGAIALAIGGLLALGGSRLFSDRLEFVTYFDGSIAGLEVGAPVTFGGVRIGSVADILLRVNSRTLAARIPVYGEIDRSRITYVGGPERAGHEELEAVVQRGLRARLASESLVTGQLTIELGFYPDTPIELAGTDMSVPEVPSLPSDLEQLRTRFEKLPIENLVVSANDAIGRLDKLLAAAGRQRLLPNLGHSLARFERLVGILNHRIVPIAFDVEQTSQAARETLTQAKALFRNVNSELAAATGDGGSFEGLVEDRINPLADRLEAVSRSAENVFRQAGANMALMEGMLSPDAPFQYQLQQALNEFAEAARAVRELAEEIEQNPNALLTGKQ